jgi:hypothetical protein
MNNAMTIREIDKFIALLSNTIETGDVSILTRAIIYYENKIPIQYINMGKNIISELVIEKIESIQIF